jgi:hypothetical protein
VSKAAYIILVTILLYLALAHRVYDDPFITYRYAENLRSGLGFVYNPGEQILSTTTPLFAMLLALLGIFWPGTLPQLANIIGTLSVALGGLLLWDLGKTWKVPPVAWSSLLLYPTFPLLLNTLGSETPLFLALVLGTFALYARKHYNWAVLLVALAVLTRSDSVLVATILAGHYLWQNRAQLWERTFWRQQPWLWIGVAAGLLLAWHAFAWLYFGAPLPVTLAAKQAQGRMAISQHFAPGMLTVADWYAGRWQYGVELLLAIIGVGFAVAKNRQWLLVLGWTGLYFLAYSLLGVTRYFWYYAPLVPGWVIAVGLGMAFLNWLPLPVWLSIPFSGKRIRQTAMILLVAALFIAQSVDLYKMSQRNDPRYAIYRAAGEWINQNTLVNANVGALEVGIIGFYAQRPMVDFAGLIQPEVAAQMKSETTYDDTAIWATITYQPQYLVLILGAHPRLESEIVAEFCQPIKQFIGSQYGYNDMIIFVCQYD